MDQALRNSQRNSLPPRQRPNRLHLRVADYPDLSKMRLNGMDLENGMEWNIHGMDWNGMQADLNSGRLAESRRWQRPLALRWSPSCPWRSLDYASSYFAYLVMRDAFWAVRVAVPRPRITPHEARLYARRA